MPRKNVDRGDEVVFSGQKTLATGAAQEIAVRRQDRRLITLKNTSTALPVYLGTSTISKTTGVYVAPRTDVTIPTNAAIYGTVSDAAGATVTYVETYNQGSTAINLLGRLPYFDANTYALRGSDFSNNADGKKGTVSFWLKSDTDVNEGFVIMNDNVIPYFAVNKTLTNGMRIRGNTSAGVEKLDMHSSDNSILIADGWVHVVASWDLSVPVAHMYINGVSDKVANTLLDGDIDYTRPECAIGAITTGGLSSSRLLGCIGQLYFKQGYIDLSDPVRLAKFFNPKNIYSYPQGAVDLAVSRPFNEDPTAALIYMNNPVATWFTNLGIGGGLTLTLGGLTACSA